VLVENKKNSLFLDFSSFILIFSLFSEITLIFKELSELLFILLLLFS
jgi:hypothetical protein